VLGLTHAYWEKAKRPSLRRRLNFRWIGNVPHCLLHNNDPRQIWVPPPICKMFVSGGPAPVDHLGHPQVFFRLEPDAIGHPAFPPQCK